MGVLNGAHPNELIALATPWLRQKNIKTVIDVGANTGQFSAAAKYLMPEVRIYAFEPLPDCFAQLKKKLADKPGVKLFNAAAGDHAGEGTIRTNRFAKSSSLLPMDDTHKENFPWALETAEQPVKLVTLDDMMGEMELVPPLLLKIDVQGYEDRVLQGARKLLGNIDTIIIEVSFRPLYKGQPLFPQIHQTLTQAGFTYSGDLGRRTSPLDGSILQADAVFLRNQ